MSIRGRMPAYEGGSNSSRRHRNQSKRLKNRHQGFWLQVISNQVWGCRKRTADLQAKAQSRTGVFGRTASSPGSRVSCIPSHLVKPSLAHCLTMKLKRNFVPLFVSVGLFIGLVAARAADPDFWAANLHKHGWEYIVVDIQWYEPQATGFDYRKDAKLDMDGWGRLVPATNKFPSAMDGKGFKPLADYVHSLGLKFGVHLMRGIPRQAVVAESPIKNTRYTAADIADTNSICRWNGDMYGVDTSRPGGQEYYDSVFDQLAAWNVDFVKVDDLSRPYHTGEIEAIRTAIDQTGRKIVFSTSPGATPVNQGEHVSQHANMWRISDDFWDAWPQLLAQFDRLRNWTPFRAPGHFPDADMLPIGVLQMGKNKTHFSRDEQITLISLWSITRSPLMIGADLTKLDDFTLSLLTNDEVIAVNQKSSNNHELFHRDGFYGWVADVPGSTDKYLALFNTHATSETNAAISMKLSELGFDGNGRIRDLWQNKDLGTQ